MPSHTAAIVKKLSLSGPEKKKKKKKKKLSVSISLSVCLTHSLSLTHLLTHPLTHLPTHRPDSPFTRHLSLSLPPPLSSVISLPPSNYYSMEFTKSDRPLPLHLHTVTQADKTTPGHDLYNAQGAHRQSNNRNIATLNTNGHSGKYCLDHRQRPQLFLVVGYSMSLQHANVSHGRI